MTFGSPAALWALLLVPAAAALYVLVQRRRRRYAVRFTNLDLLATIATKLPRWRRHVPPALFLLALATLVFALARPLVDRRVPREHAGVVLAIDRSGSMRATDIDPSRLDAARDAAHRFVDGLPERFEVGLVSFSSEAEVLNVPTVEREPVQQSIDAIATSGATAMGDGLAAALDLVAASDGTDQGDRSPYAIVLLSDGFNTAGTSKPDEVAAAAASADVPVHTIALGSTTAVVPVPGPGGVTRLVPAPPDRTTLEAIAETTGGLFFEAPSGADLTSIYEGLGSRIAYRTERVEATAVVVTSAMVLMAAAGGVSLAWFGRLP